MALDPDDLLTTQEACTYVRVTSNTIKAWVQSGKLRVRYTPAGRPRYRRGDLTADSPEAFEREDGAGRA